MASNRRARRAAAAKRRGIQASGHDRSRDRMASGQRPGMQTGSPGVRAISFGGGSVRRIEAAGDSEDELPRFEMLAYRGGKLRLANWPYPVVIALDGLSNRVTGIKVFKDHSPSLIVGHLESAELTDEGLVATGVVSGAGAVAREFVQSSRNGFPWESSIGAAAEVWEDVEPGVEVEANGQVFEGPLHLVRKASLNEISVVAIGADGASTTKLAADAAGDHGGSAMDFTKWLRALGFDPEQLSEEQTTNLRAQFDRLEASAGEGGDGGDPDEGAEGDGEGDGGEGDEPVTAAAGAGRSVQAAGGAGVSAHRKAMAAETRRIGQIREVIAKHIEGGDAKIEAQAIGEGWSPDKAELAALRAGRSKVQETRSRGGGTEIGFESVCAAACMAAGMSADFVAEQYGEQAVDKATHRSLQGLSMQGLARMTLQAAGESVPMGRMTTADIVAALEADARINASGWSGISLSGVLGNAMNKALFSGYESVESVVNEICRVSSLSDFKAASRYRINAEGRLVQVSASGELEHTSLSEQAFTNQLDTWGRMLTLTRKDIINDDLGAFMELPTEMGAMAAETRERELFTLLLSNPSSFFSTGNGNYFEGADSVLSIASLTEAVTLFHKMKTPGGRFAMARPTKLLVPPELFPTADQLYTSTNVNNGSTSDTPEANPHRNRYRPVMSPFLSDTDATTGISGASTTGWFLLGDPNRVACMEIGYLNGIQTPTIEEANAPFNVLGRAWRIYWDFGVAMQDTRGGVKSKGAA